MMVVSDAALWGGCWKHFFGFLLAPGAKAVVNDTITPVVWWIWASGSVGMSIEVSNLEKKQDGYPGGNRSCEWPIPPFRVPVLYGQ